MIVPPEDIPKAAYPLYFAALAWAVSDDAVIEEFTRQTGVTYRAPASNMDAMIDAACGVEQKLVAAFVEWFNEHIWGSWEEPDHGILQEADNGQ